MDLSLRSSLMRLLTASETPPASLGDWICRCRWGRSNRERYCSRGQKIGPQKRLYWNEYIASLYRRGGSCIQLTFSDMKFQRFCGTLLKRPKKGLDSDSLVYLNLAPVSLTEGKFSRIIFTSGVHASWENMQLSKNYCLIRGTHCENLHVIIEYSSILFYFGKMKA